MFSTSQTNRPRRDPDLSLWGAAQGPHSTSGLTQSRLAVHCVPAEPHLPPQGPHPALQIPFLNKQRPLEGCPPSSCTLGSRPCSTISPDQPTSQLLCPPRLLRAFPSRLSPPPSPHARPGRAGLPGCSPRRPRRSDPTSSTLRPGQAALPRPQPAPLGRRARRRAGRGRSTRCSEAASSLPSVGALGPGWAMAPAGGRRRRGLLRLQPRRRSGNRYARGPRRETGAAGPGLRLLRLILTAAAGGGRRRRRSTAQAPTVRARERLPPAGP